MSYLPLLDVELLSVILGFSTGVAFGNAGKNFDNEVQNTQWFKNRNRLVKWFLKFLMDVTHHFQYGLILMLYAMVYIDMELHPVRFWLVYSFGFGLVVTDIKDIPRRFRRFFEFPTK